MKKIENKVNKMTNKALKLEKKVKKTLIKSKNKECSHKNIYGGIPDHIDPL